MVVIALLMASLWLVGVSSPQSVGGFIHVLLMSAVVLLLLRIFEAPNRRTARQDRWPPPPWMAG
jgi:hypothetical protein